MSKPKHIEWQRGYHAALRDMRKKVKAADMFNHLETRLHIIRSFLKMRQPKS